MCMSEAGWARETRGTAGKGAGVGRTHRTSGSILRNMAWILWAMGSPGRVFSTGVRRWDSHQAAGEKMNCGGGKGMGVAGRPQQ